MKSLLLALLIAASPAAVHAASTAADKTPPAAAATNSGAPADSPRTEQSAKAGADKDKNEEFDIAQMMAVFDKLFPAQPDPAPDRLALAHVTANGLFPDGTYGRMLDGMMSGIVDRVLDLSDADFGKKGGKGQAPGATLREQAMKDDLHFVERMRITQRVFSEEMAKIATLLEPKLREGLARSMARRFDRQQLADINAFLASDSGRAFGSQSMAMWVDSDVMRAITSSFPEMFAAMPDAMKRLEAETAHLPKPPKDKDGDAEEEEDSDRDADLEDSGEDEQVPASEG